MLSPFLKSAQTSAWKVLVCEVRWEEGGGRILDFRRNTNPSHLPLTSTRNWPKSLSIFSNHVKRKTPWLEIGRGEGGGLVHGGEGWPALDYLLFEFTLQCRCTTSKFCFTSILQHMLLAICLPAFSWVLQSADHNVQRAVRQCARAPECRQPGKWASYQNIVHCIWAGWALQGACGQVLKQHK